jgi:DNA-binding NarL/FixJ family response regulator
MPIRLLFACRDKDLAAASCARLVEASGSHVAGEATHIEMAVSAAAAIQPDVLMLEHAPADEKKAWQVLARLPVVSSKTRALLLCESCTHQMIAGFVRRGVNGCVLKTASHR